jgi:hypothetical protein
MLKKMFAMMVSGCAVALCGVASAGNLAVENGGFESYTGGYSGLPSQVANPGHSGTGYTELTGWSNYGYTFAFAPGTAETGSWSQEFNNYLSLWGTSNGGLNSIPATSPAGGNFIISDPAFEQGPIEQEITGLTIGEAYNVSFYWGAAQQNGFTGDTWEGWKVSLGQESHVTPVPSGQNPGPDAGTLANPSHAFQGWFHTTMTFTATNKTEILSFMSLGGPDGVPPMAMLDGVTFSAAVPEPSSFALSAFGLIGLAVLRMRRRAKMAQA